MVQSWKAQNVAKNQQKIGLLVAAFFGLLNWRTFHFSYFAGNFFHIFVILAYLGRLFLSRSPERWLSSFVFYSACEKSRGKQWKFTKKTQFTFMGRNMRIIIMEALLAEQTWGKLCKLGRPDDINLWIYEFSIFSHQLFVAWDNKKSINIQVTQQVQRSASKFLVIFCTLLGK